LIEDQKDPGVAASPLAVVVVAAAVTKDILVLAVLVGTEIEKGVIEEEIGIVTEKEIEEETEEGIGIKTETEERGIEIVVETRMGREMEEIGMDTGTGEKTGGTVLGVLHLPMQKYPTCKSKIVYLVGK